MISDVLGFMTLVVRLISPLLMTGKSRLNPAKGLCSRARPRLVQPHPGFYREHLSNRQGVASAERASSIVQDDALWVVNCTGTRGECGALGAARRLKLVGMLENGSSTGVEERIPEDFA